MNVKRNINLLVILALLVGAMMVLPSDAQAKKDPFTNISISGTTQNGGVFSGVFTVTSFVTNGAGTGVDAVGTLSGVVVDATGAVVKTISAQTIQLPVRFRRSTCDILTLELGPLDLDLLGLQVHLDKVVLNIKADPTGGLLGQLLCAIADALGLGQIGLPTLVGLLNQLLQLL